MHIPNSVVHQKKRASRNARMPILAVGLSALLGCTTQLSPRAVAWNDSTSRIAPESIQDASAAAGDGYLRIETDTDRQLIGDETYYELRRPYDLYTNDGHLLQADVDNQGGRNGEVPILHSIAPGRYIVASVYGTAYRKVQVEVRPGTVTSVPSAVLSDAPRVFGSSR
jgi:hypothetical protein